MPEWFRSLDGQIFVDEKEDVFCLWRADYAEEKRRHRYGMDLFERRGRLWKRSGEEHLEYAHEPEICCGSWSRRAFVTLRRHVDGPQQIRGGCLSQQ